MAKLGDWQRAALEDIRNKAIARQTTPDRELWAAIMTLANAIVTMEQGTADPDAAPDPAIEEGPGSVSQAPQTCGRRPRASTEADIAEEQQRVPDAA